VVLNKNLLGLLDTIARSRETESMKVSQFKIDENTKSNSLILELQRKYRPTSIEWRRNPPGVYDILSNHCSRFTLFAAG